MNEFEIIKNYFANQGKNRPDVLHGIGDDCAIVTIPQNHELAITTDTLVSNVHFPEYTSAYDIGHKCLAVNLSDLAASGATPAWVTLAMTIPEANPDWLKNFSAGFFNLAHQFKVQLIGGDLTRGALSITITAFGFVPKGEALLRSKAVPDDLIYVTNTLGDAGLALQFLQNKITLNSAYEHTLITRLNRPMPRIDVGEALRGLAHASIDISDGLLADLNHILEESHVGASINVDKLPLSDAMKHATSRKHGIELALGAGDDYEICFIIPKDKQKELEKRFVALSSSYTCIGVITKQLGLEVTYEDGKKYQESVFGYQHF